MTVAGKPIAWLQREIRTPPFTKEARLEASQRKTMTVNKAKQRRLTAKGWKFGSTEEFLALSAEEEAYVEMKVTLSRALKERRINKRLNQTQLAKLINSSQSRVAKMEAGDPSVSMDLLVKSLLALGASKKDVARSIVDYGA